MIFTIPSTRQIDITHIRVTAPVRYDDEDIPYDFPGRSGKTWTAEIDVATGAIRHWPKGRAGYMHMKVRDEGVYHALGADGAAVLSREDDYVPGFFPGDHYGDYLIFNIDADGVIAGWRCDPSDLEDWAPVGEDD